MQATYTIRITGQAGAYQATATFPAGLFASRRPITGPAAATVQAAIAALSALPKLHITLAAIASK